MSNMKIIAYYLPQFHSIPENDDWWGKGFTEWTNVKDAKPLFNEHYQPRIPLNKNYYNLLDDKVKIWQAELAKKYGIYGFCYYHYWYNGKMLLEKPMEQMLANKRIDIPFCISWCNEPWTKSWVGDVNKVLIPQSYGEEKEWTEHYKYLKKFFKDSRYIFLDNKPLLIIYRADVIHCIKNMLECFNKLAINDGFNGITTIAVCKSKNRISKINEYFDYIIDAEPGLFFEYFASKDKSNYYFLKKIWNKLNQIFERINGYSLDNSKFFSNLKKVYKKQDNYNSLTIFPEYKLVLDKIVSMDPLTNKSIPQFFSDWDNTPRYKEKGSLIPGVSIDIFKKYFKSFVVKSKNIFDKDIMFFSAWNEWAEGSILEPDEKYKYGFLEAIKEVLIDLNEFPYQ